MQCELCGNLRRDAFRVLVEGGMVVACGDCARLGRVVERIEKKKPEKRKSTVSSKVEPDVVFESSGGLELSDDYAERVRRAREGMGLKQEELARAINEPASLVQRIESGKLVPSSSVVQRIEGRLGVDLRDKGEKVDVAYSKKTASGPVTFGDVVVVRKRKA